MGALRIILAISVVSAHYKIAVPLLGEVPFRGHGAFSVCAFFIVSGFYMALVLTEKYGDSTSTFYISRILRVMPALLVVLVLSATLAVITQQTSISLWSMPLDEAKKIFSQMSPLWQSVVVVANATGMFSDALLFVSFDQSGGAHVLGDMIPEGDILGTSFSTFPPAWSLSVEMMFYLVAPFIVGRRWPLLIALMLGSLLVRVVVSSMPGGTTYVWAYAFLPSEFIFFALGIGSYQIYRRVRDSWWARPAGYAALAVFVLNYFVFNHLPLRTGTLLVIYSVLLALALPLLFCAFKQSKLDRAVGDLSYVVYVTHFMAFKLATMLAPHPSALLAYSMLICVSLAFYLVIEVPVEKYRSAYSARRHAVRVGATIGDRTQEAIGRSAPSR